MEKEKSSGNSGSGNWNGGWWISNKTFIAQYSDDGDGVSVAEVMPDWAEQIVVVSNMFTNVIAESEILEAMVEHNKDKYANKFRTANEAELNEIQEQHQLPIALALVRA